MGRFQTTSPQRKQHMTLATEVTIDNNKRSKVDLPENHQKWASNDQVAKPTVVLRGPNYLVTDPAASSKQTQKRYLPTILAYTLTGAVLVIGLIYFILEMSSILK